MAAVTDDDSEGKTYCRLDFIEEDENVDKLNVAKTNKLREKEAELQEGLAKQKQARSEKKPENEQVAYFEVSFANTRESIEGKLAKAESVQTDRQAVINLFDEAMGECQKLSTFVAQSKLFLPNFVFRKYQAISDGIQQNVQEKREEMIPKKKFAFRERKKAAESGGKSDVTDAAKSNRRETQRHLDERASALSVKSGFVVAGGDDAEIEVYSRDIDQQDVVVRGMRGSVVRLYGSPSTVHLTSLRDCRVFMGPVSTSVFVEACEGCELHVVCQQLRTHSTSRTTLHLHCTTRAIIEDCHQLVFTPYSWTYENMERDWHKSGLHGTVNNWTAIDDFNWLVANQPSPNYTLLEPSNNK